MTWGVVSTIRAPIRDVLNFAAWHLELGAHRLFIYLDEPDPAIFNLLKGHPRIRPITTDDEYWERHGKKPLKHQVRQVRNATRTYRRRADVDWLCHIDVDEFLVPDRLMDALLADLPEDCQVARLRPMEALAPQCGEPSQWNFKTFTHDRQERRHKAQRTWPNYGAYLNGGFLSHVAGKILVRTGLPDAEFKIHNFFSQGVENPGAVEFSQISLAHLHAKSWPAWLALYRYRLEKGSYRASLKPTHPPEKGGLTMHDLFRIIEAEGGETALEKFFEEVCAATPDHLFRLEQEGLLRRVNLPLDTVREKHFGTEIRLD